MAATDLESGTALLISNTNILSDVINEDATKEVVTPSGNIPSVRKALADNLYFQDPVPWSNGNNETNFNQLRTFTDGTVWWSPSATNVNPVPMGVTPVGDSNWYPFQDRNLKNNILEEVTRFNIKGTFAAGFTYDTVDDVGLDNSGNPWSYTGTLPFTVVAGTVPSNPDYEQEDFGGIDSISGLKREIVTRTVNLTLSEVVSKTDLSIGQYVRLKDRDLTLFEVQTSQINDGYSILDIGNSQSLVLIDSTVTTYSFGYFDGMTGDLQPLLQAFDDYIQTNEILGQIIFKAKGSIGSQLVLGRLASSNRPLNQANVVYELDLTTTYTDVDNYAVIIDDFTLSSASGFIDVTCGGPVISERRQLGAILCSDTERGNFNGRLTGIGGIRYGVTFESGPKTTLTHIDYVRVLDCGIREDAFATEITNNGSVNSVNQNTTLTISDFSSRVQAGDIIHEVLDDGSLEPHYVREMNGNVATVFPWFTNTNNGRAIKLNTGGGVYTIGGDSSLINITRVDGFRCGILCNNSALYPASIGILHGNFIGTGLTIGRNRNAAIGGNIGEFYLEGGGNLDVALVETSTSISGFSINSTISTIDPNNIYNIGGAKPSNTGKILTRFLSDMDGVDSAAVTQNGVRNQNEIRSSVLVSNRTSEPVTYFRNTGTVNVTPNVEAINDFGLDSATLILMGTGNNGQPTGTITLEPNASFSGWTLNGSNSIVLSGLTNAIKITMYFRLGSTDVLVFREDLTKA